jgi:hypothetical protein
VGEQMPWVSKETKQVSKETSWEGRELAGGTMPEVPRVNQPSWMALAGQASWPQWPTSRLRR